MGGYIHDDLKRIMEFQNLENRIHALELNFKSLEELLSYVVQETSQHPGRFRQEIEQLEARLKSQIRSTLLATGVGLGVILLIVAL